MATYTYRPDISRGGTPTTYIDKFGNLRTIEGDPLQPRATTGTPSISATLFPNTPGAEQLSALRTTPGGIPISYTYTPEQLQSLYGRGYMPNYDFGGDGSPGSVPFQASTSDGTVRYPLFQVKSTGTTYSPEELQGKYGRAGMPSLMWAAPEQTVLLSQNLSRILQRILAQHSPQK